MSNPRAERAARMRAAQGPRPDLFGFLRPSGPIGRSRPQGARPQGATPSAPPSSMNAGFDHGGGRSVPPRAAAALAVAPSLPAITSSVVPVPRNSGASNASVALQNAAQGIKAQPAWDWNAPENAQMLAAAESRGKAAAAARGGRGYLSFPGGAAAASPMTADDAVLLAQGAGALGGLKPGATADDAILAGQAAGAFENAGRAPGALSPADEAYWQGADIQAWANANKGLADQLRLRHGLAPWSQAAPRQQAWQGEALAPEAVARAGTLGSGLTAPFGTDPAQRMAPAQAAAGVESGQDLGQEDEENRRRALRLAAFRGGESLASPGHPQPVAFGQPGWAQGWFK
jgi:hypothetical protein